MSNSEDYSELLQRWYDRISKRAVVLDLRMKAISKERPRTGRSGHMYTPKRTRDFEKLVADHAIAMNIETFTGPLSVYVTVQEEMPSSWEYGKRLLATYNMITPTRGDLDNKVKAITDALNGIAYFDDSQIAELKAVKRYANEHRIFVTITEIGLTPLQVEQALYSIKAQSNGSGKSGIRRT